MDPISAAEKLVPLTQRGPDATLVVCACVVVAFLGAGLGLVFKFWTSSIATIQNIQASHYQQMVQLDARNAEQKHELINSLKSNTEVIRSVLDNLKSNTDSLRSLSEKVVILSDRTGRA
jgi:uncharacterized protein HemX